MRMRHGLTDSTGMNKELKFCIWAWSTAICQWNRTSPTCSGPNSSWRKPVRQSNALLLPASVRRHQSEVEWFWLGRQIRRDTCRESPNRRDPEDTKPQSSVSRWANTGKSELEFQPNVTTHNKRDWRKQASSDTAISLSLSVYFNDHISFQVSPSMLHILTVHLIQFIRRLKMLHCYKVIRRH